MLEYLTSDTFKEKIFDFEQSEDWGYNGEKPCLITFSASWCGPCKTLTPVLEELSKEYKDKVNFYKVDVDEQPELASTFNIRGVPHTLLVPTDGDPKKMSGAYPKGTISKAIDDFLLK